MKDLNDKGAMVSDVLIGETVRKREILLICKNEELSGKGVAMLLQKILIEVVISSPALRTSTTLFETAVQSLVFSSAIL